MTQAVSFGNLSDDPHILQVRLASGRATVHAFITSQSVIRCTYDPLSRLTSATYSGNYTYTFAYAYDPVGNPANYGQGYSRTEQTATITSTQVTNYVYDAANHLTSVNGQTYTWDDNGNLLNDGSALYRYDQANPVKSGQGHGRLISTTLGSVTSLYNYNGDGVRLRQVVGGTPTTYTQDMAAPLPVVLQAQTGSATTQYLYSLGTRPIGQYTDAWEYLLPDARPCPTLHWSVGGPLGVGSVRQIADASGNVTLAESYEPYGTVLTSTGTASSIFGYAGEQFDTYIKLVFLRSRYYDPGTGRFLSKDVWQGDYTRPQSLDGWLYVEGNPANRTDPSGRDPWWCGDDSQCIQKYYDVIQNRSSQVDPRFGGRDFLSSLPPIPANTEYTMHDPFGFVAEAVGIEADQFKVPREFVAAALNYENEREKGALGWIRRTLKKSFNPCFEWLDPGHDSGFGYSIGIGNVKPANAETAENWYLNNYDPSSQEYQDMASLHQLNYTKLQFDEVSVLYVAANLRIATDLIYGLGYMGPISKEGARRIIGSNNQPTAYRGGDIPAGNYGIDLLIRASHLEVPLWFFPGK